MADYNLFRSTVTSDLVEGTENADSISVYGNHSTVQAMGGNDTISVNGGRHDNGIWIGDEDNLIFAGAGNDSVAIYSRGVTVQGEAGNDTVSVYRDHTFANGGEGDDYLSISDQHYSRTLSEVTLTGGEGADTFAVTPYYYGASLGAVVTDFTNDDALRVNDDERRILTYTESDGNVVISDSKKRYVEFVSNVEPQFNITLQGVSMSEVADAKYYHYNSAGTVPDSYSTLGELFGITSTPSTTEPPQQTSTETTTQPVSTPTETSTTTTTQPLVTPPPTNTTTTTQPATTGTSETETGGTTIINNYYGDYYNVVGNSGTVLVASSVEGGIGNTYNYSGGDKSIENYKEGEVVQLSSDYQGIDLKENSFFVNSGSGHLEIKNSRDKFIGYSATNTDVIAYSYVASGSGVVDGRGKSQAEIMIGADNGNNQMYAGNGDSSLWGGNGGNDTMFGGNAYTEFFYTGGNGNDVIQNAHSTDIVNLLGVSLNQISSYSFSESHVSLQFNDGGSLRVNGNSNIGYRVENQVYVCNQSTGQWTTR